MEEEMERLKEEERCDAQEMQLLTSSPRPGETARRPYPSRGLLLYHAGAPLNTDYASWESLDGVFLARCVASQPPGR